MMTTAVEVIFAWIAIGLAASIAGWIWPFRRGVAGIALNALVAIFGAIAGGVIGRAAGAYANPMSAASFVFAAIGAILALVLAHVAWSRAVHTRPRGGH